MDEQIKSTKEDDRLRPLRTYLRDHTVGAESAIQLFKAFRDHHADTLIGRFADNQLKEVEQDLEALKDLASRVGAHSSEVKELAGWLGEKLTRLKLAPLGSPFNSFEALEFLSLGILGKRALWRTLKSISPLNPELRGADFNVLLERAEAQYIATEEMRLQMAAHVFS